MKLTYFKDIDFLQAIKGLFKELKVPMNYVADEPTSAKEILKDTYKENATFALVDDVYFVGMVDDAAFEQNESLAVDKIKSDYDGVLIFGITLHPRENNLLPTRSQLAEISRAFNREFYYTPVVLVFKYKDDNADYIAFANTERLKFKQAWREGEKSGKVSLLRDINIKKPHRGHEDIIKQLKITTSGKNQVDSFAKLYTHWQEVFNVNVLNKKFYQELSNWYFWAVKHVTFPNMPTMNDVQEKFGVIEQQKLDDLIQEHNAKNVIRMLTRLLFTWFIKEKKLIPEDLFDLDSLQQDILKDISPYHDENSLFSDANQDSVYYKAILQNLFFASLNCPIEADGLDNRTRGFRGLETYGKHRGIDWMMRYKNHFKNPDKFLEMMNQTVPFLNGGLFECLDDKTQNLYIDGFSDQMTKGEKLVVPDYLFFGIKENVDLSADYGAKNKAAKAASENGLINILKSYKFTITENTPIEEDVALDPELLGKVFENLLASYNPETKTTARKQTGSFYTPREIVNYMVDESLIAYLKNNILNEDEVYQEMGSSQTNLLGNEGKVGQLGLTDKIWKSKYGGTTEQLDKDLHQLFSFDTINPFAENDALQKQIIKALDKCTILDPACGSGAFPMGALQKMVHVLHKVDPNGQEWKQRQIDKVNNAIESLEEIEDSQIKEQSIKDLEFQKQDIEDAFENNELDYGRKLFLIENCIYGVDIQSIATQISKLRFFISLVVDQKIDSNKANFGVRPLPNLETKFVAANTLIGIDKPTAQTNLFDTQEVKALEKELKKRRHKLFSAKTKDTKLKYRQKDEELRNAIAAELIKSGWANDTAEKLASWDPYDQNASSSFFDPEWMFDIKDGFDVVIGNPPYVTYKGKEKVEITHVEFGYLLNRYKKSAEYKVNSYALFIEQGMDVLNTDGTLSFIIPSTILQNEYLKNIRKYILNENHLETLVVFSNGVFEAVTDSIIIQIKKGKGTGFTNVLKKNSLDLDIESNIYESWNNDVWLKQNGLVMNLRASLSELKILDKIDSNTIKLDKLLNVYVGVVASGIKKFITDVKIDENHKQYLLGRDIDNYTIKYKQRYLNFLPSKLHSNTDINVYLQPSKLLVRKTGNRLISVQDNQQFFTDQSLYNLYPKKLEKNKSYIKIINVFLNSKTLDFYFNKKMITNPDVFPYIKGIHLKELPIKIDDRFIPSVSFFSDLLQTKKNQVFFDIVNALVFNLYFLDHMQEKEIDVLGFVEKDIATVMRDRNFEKLSDTEKEAVIEQLHKTWSHPDNEVVKRMALFKEKSPEILKPILES